MAGYCIEWEGCRDVDGYGIVYIERKSFKAHRLAWMEIHGEIPSILRVCHKCDNPPCININHLFVGTDADNLRDSRNKGRHQYRVHYGVDNGNSKLTVEDVAFIKQNQGVVPIKALAMRFGVSRDTVYNIYKEKVWKYV